ncbi:C1 family peptidase [Limosilactobacillus reuteri]|uniref:aminopeptidase C n=1 Tax=Limosilactobacillus reuteri TaxID=1598 RepID=UPI001E08576D|nr:C1 family peptidase [Limosilactobacillus reuteri]MCC4499330.1 C1 family peptidase [Limosilactobacillus reuteri]MCC4503593.1 C1 family peptidase [Limosilactobacillus reuteri]MCC4505821.1 C1 family peptidase [Limosilactobacillus reuteri]MCC4516029.1 C1 family peptidase [Limosilactobacillus reuteri]HJE41804.1 C1 family peptidase [Limosilactobacillus reuteri]
MTEEHDLTSKMVEKLKKEFHSRKDAEIIARAIQKNGIKAASEDPTASERLHRAFSYEIKTGKPTNQRHSGRCWSFAALNTLRHKFATKYKFKDFELSQNYLFFWDRIERANMFFQKIIATADKPLHDRTVDFYLSFALNDGGQWANAASIIEKYGVVPEYVMPDTHNTKDTSDVAEVFDSLMRKDAIELRAMVQTNTSATELQEAQERMMGDVYKIAAYSFGEPPAKFDLEYRDDDKKFHQVLGLTPLKFYHEYFDTNLSDYVVVTNAPDHEMDRSYLMPAQDSVVDGLPIKFVNVPFAELQEGAIKQLQAGETVWVGNDVLQQMDRKRGLMDAKLYHREELLDVDFVMDKKHRLETKQAVVSHAMTLTGFDMINDQPTRWKIENSWGKDNGDNGYFVMTQDWFEEYTYEAVINKKYLSDRVKKVAASEPVTLPAWDSLQ